MKRNHILLLSLLTLVMVIATVLYVRAENKQELPAIAGVDPSADEQIILTPEWAAVEGDSEQAGSTALKPELETPESSGHKTAETENALLNTQAATEGSTATPLELPSPTIGTVGSATRTTAPTSTQVGLTASAPTQTEVPTDIPNATPTDIPNATPTDIPNATPTQTSVPPTSIPTSTSAPLTGWGGEWTVWFEQENGTYSTGEVTINLNATEITGTGTLGGTLYSFEGFAPDAWRANGSWTSSSKSGIFIWEMLSDGQFGGSRDGAFGFCGARPGLPKPDPCFIPTIS